MHQQQALQPISNISIHDPFSFNATQQQQVCSTEEGTEKRGTLSKEVPPHRFLSNICVRTSPNKFFSIKKKSIPKPKFIFYSI